MRNVLVTTPIDAVGLRHGPAWDIAVQVLGPFDRPVELPPGTAAATARPALQGTAEKLRRPDEPETPAHVGPSATNISPTCTSAIGRFVSATLRGIFDMAIAEWVLAMLDEPDTATCAA